MTNKLLLTFMVFTLFSCDPIKFNSNVKPLETIQDSPAVSCTPSKKIDHFAIYYGYPSSLNYDVNAWTMSLVISDLSRYESVVLGGGLEDPGHGDYANTTSLIAGAGTTKFFGYIAIGNTQNLSIAQLQTNIDNWYAISGLDGIFIDEFGMDFKAGGVSEADYRIRQKTILDYVHSKGLAAIMNAFDPDDVFVKESGNPLTITNGDRYLYESYYLSSTARETWSFYRAKIAKLKAAKIAHPLLKVMANTSTATDSYTQNLFDTVALAATADEIDGIAWSEAAYSASGLMNALMPFRTPTTDIDLFCTHSQVIDTSNETLEFSLSNRPVKILYNASGSPTHQ